MALGAFIAALPPMRARQYSIASSPLVDPGRCALTVSVLEVPALGADRLHQGVASTFLARLKEGDTLGVAVRPSQAGFHLPADPLTPVIMVCAGSGIAPFRGFLQERAVRKEAGEPLGPALLFFGVRDPDTDFLYRDQLEHWQDAGILSLRMAFSATGQGGIVHVQDAIWRDRAEIAALFRAGARILLCGDGERMAPAVRDTFIRIYEAETQATHAEALAWAERIEREGVRYVADIYA
jgi:cytochrome P450 / NADPH-cytochrome P450 reductase